MCCQLLELGRVFVVIGMRSGRQGFDFLALQPYRATQPPYQWVLVDERPGLEADRSPPSCAEVKECVGLYLPCSIRLCRVAPIMSKDDFAICCLSTRVFGVAQQKFPLQFTNK